MTQTSREKAGNAGLSESRNGKTPDREAPFSTKRLPKIHSISIFSMLLLLSVLTGCSTLMAQLQPIDPQSATLTAMITPTVVQPTLDLKGNAVLEDDSCLVASSASISTFDDAEDGGIFTWASAANIFAYVAPEGRYWGWFSGDAVVWDFSENEMEPAEMATTGLKVFGDFAFSPDSKELAFVAFRPSDNIYTIMVADLASGLKTTVDLFPGTAAETDAYSSSKSVIDWIDNERLRVSTSCGVDCEKILVADRISNLLTEEEEVRKKGHTGREFPQHVIEYDDRVYPAMSQPNWSPDEKYVFYTDTQDKAWILNTQDKSQFELPLRGGDILQSLWSADGSYLALRKEESIEVYKIDCN